MQNSEVRVKFQMPRAHVREKRILRRPAVLPLAKFKFPFFERPAQKYIYYHFMVVYEIFVTRLQ